MLDNKLYNTELIDGFISGFDEEDEEEKKIDINKTDIWMLGLR